MLSRARHEWLEGSPRSFAALLAGAFDDLDLLLQGGAAQYALPSDPEV